MKRLFILLSVLVFQSEILSAQNPDTLGHHWGSVDMRQIQDPPKSKKIGLGFNFGGLLPASGLGEINSSLGYYLELGISYYLGRLLYLEIVGGNYEFREEGADVGGGTLFLNGEILPVSDKVFLTFGVGAGYYVPKEDNGSLGFAGRLAASWFINQKLKGSLESGYFNMPKYDRSFFTGGVGVKFLF